MNKILSPLLDPKVTLCPSTCTAGITPLCDAIWGLKGVNIVEKACNIIPLVVIHQKIGHEQNSQPKWEYYPCHVCLLLPPVACALVAKPGNPSLGTKEGYRTLMISKITLTLTLV